MQLLAVAATAVSVPNVFLMFFMRNIKLDEEDEKDEMQLDNVVEKLKGNADRRESEPEPTGKA